MTYIIKLIIWGVLLVFILGYSIYTGLVADLGTAVHNFNYNFISFLPLEAKLFFSIIIFGLIVSFIYSFKD